MEHPIDRLKALFAEIGSERLDLGPVYAPEVRFEDPFHVLEGRDALDAYFVRLNRNVERCTFTFHDDVRGDGVAFLAWTMDLRLRRPRNHVVLPGATRVRWSDAGITEHRDFFDAGAMVYEQVPLLGLAVRAIKSSM